MNEQPNAFKSITPYTHFHIRVEDGVSQSNKMNKNLSSRWKRMWSVVCVCVCLHLL